MPQKKLSELSDEDLIIMAKEGNINAMNALVERYQKPVFNFALRMIGDRQNAGDITQETFIKVIKSLPSYKPKNFKNYVYKIANNTAYDRLREKKVSISFETEVTIEDDEKSELKNLISDKGLPSPEQSLMRSETEKMFSKMLKLLPYEQRQVFIMREFSGMSFREIAGVCGCSLNTVLSRMQYSLKKLRKMLDGKI